MPGFFEVFVIVFGCLSFVLMAGASVVNASFWDAS